MTSLLVTEINKEEFVLWEQVLCIYYPFHFQNDTKDIRVLIDLGSEVNIMTLAYISKLGPKVHHTDIGAQKIDGSTLKIFGMVLTSFQVED